MTLRIYNTLGRKLEVFEPINEGEVRMYTCGPTVWNYAHIGNYRTFVFEDLLRRYLKFKGYKVTQVMNITDVEDNIIKGMRSTGKSRKELCDFYEKAFLEDSSTLGIERAEHYPRATEHIGDMVELIKKLMAKGYAYATPDGSVYFKVSQFRQYGALSGIRTDELKTGARVAQDHYEKMEANDFALWKAWDPEDGEVFWDTELGRGRPGWHIECSAMSMKYLGESFDIHTGGLDNRFPHHENEIAQSESATGKRFVRYWMHSGFLNVKGEEMHKSVGNVVYLRSLLEEGWEPATIRLFLISSRYSDPSNITDAALEQSRAQRQRLQDFVLRLQSVKGKEGTPGDLAGELEGEFQRAMDDDLNTASALGSIFGFAKTVNGLIDEGQLGETEAARMLAALNRINAVLGVLSFGSGTLPPRLAALIEARESARKRKEFAESDRIRKVLLAEGIELEDTPTGTVWKRKGSG